jgi:hypothetical protein
MTNAAGQRMSKDDESHEQTQDRDRQAGLHAHIQTKTQATTRIMHR